MNEHEELEREYEEYVDAAYEAYVARMLLLPWQQRVLDEPLPHVNLMRGRSK